MFNLNVRQSLGAVQAFGELKLSSERQDNNLSFTGRDVLAGYGLFNVGADWKINSQLSLLARLNNLTDTSYVLANGYTMPGRNAFVSLSWAM
jgi:vitamin B12 transporter